MDITRVRSLDLDGVDKKVEKFVINQSPNFHRLETLAISLDFLYHPNVDFNDLFVRRDCFPSLKKLVATRMFSNSGEFKWKDNNKTWNGITTLTFGPSFNLQQRNNINHNYNPTNDFPHFFKNPCIFRNLRSLDLCFLQGNDLVKLDLPSIRNLSLLLCRKKFEITTNDTLTRVNTTAGILRRIFPHQTHLRSIYISGAVVGERCVDWLFEDIERNLSQLHDLDLNYVYVSKKVNLPPSLKRLRLGRISDENNNNNSGVGNLIYASKDDDDYFPKLTSLELKSITNFPCPEPPVFNFCSTLSRLVIWEVEGVNVEFFCKNDFSSLTYLEVNTIESLDLTKKKWSMMGSLKLLRFSELSKLDDEFFRRNAASFPTLEVLEMNGCQGVIGVDWGSFEVSTLRRIVINRCGWFRDDMFRSAKDFSRLKELEIKLNKKIRGYKWGKMNALEVLCFEYCENLDDVVFQADDNFNNLRTLDLVHCHQVKGKKWKFLRSLEKLNIKGKYTKRMKCFKDEFWRNKPFPDNEGTRRERSFNNELEASDMMEDCSVM